MFDLTYTDPAIYVPPTWSIARSRWYECQVRSIFACKSLHFAVCTSRLLLVACFLVSTLTEQRTKKKLSLTFSSSFPARQTPSAHPLLGCGSRFPGHGVSIACMTPDCEGDQKRDLEAPSLQKSAPRRAPHKSRGPLWGNRPDVPDIRLGPRFHYVFILAFGSVEADSDATRWKCERSIDLLLSKACTTVVYLWEIMHL